MKAARCEADMQECCHGDRACDTLRNVNWENLRGMDTLRTVSTILTKGDNFWDYCWLFCTSSPFGKRGLCKKENIPSLEEIFCF